MRPARVAATRPSFGRNDMNDPPELCKPSIAGAPASGLLQADATAGQGLAEANTAAAAIHPDGGICPERARDPARERPSKTAKPVPRVQARERSLSPGAPRPGPVGSRAAAASELPAPSPSRLSMR